MTIKHMKNLNLLYLVQPVTYNRAQNIQLFGTGKMATRQQKMETLGRHPSTPNPLIGNVVLILPTFFGEPQRVLIGKEFESN